MAKANSARATTRVCEVPLCGASIPAGKLMCLPHWKEVPRPIRQRINQAWRTVRGRGTRAYRQAALADYRQAVAEAVTAVEANRP